MARLHYGGTGGDYTSDSTGRIKPLTEVWLWDAPTGGNRVTDFVAVSGTKNATNTITSSATGLIAIDGPDGYDDRIFASVGANGPRTALGGPDGEGMATDADVNAAVLSSGGSTVTVTGINARIDPVNPKLLVITSGDPGSAYIEVDSADSHLLRVTNL